MKRLFLALVIAAVSICAFAQKGQKAVGVNLSYGSEIKNLGIGLKGQYNFTDALRSELSFDYFLKKDGVTFWDANLNLHYLFELSERAKVYPLAGITYGHTSVKWDDADYYDVHVNGGSASDGKIGFNAGGGIQYDISDNLFVNAELKYQYIDHFDQLVVSVGLGYKF